MEFVPAHGKGMGLDDLEGFFQLKPLPDFKRAAQLQACLLVPRSVSSRQAWHHKLWGHGGCLRDLQGVQDMSVALKKLS